jgi:hypothetical protein
LSDASYIDKNTEIIFTVTAHYTGELETIYAPEIYTANYDKIIRSKSAILCSKMQNAIDTAIISNCITCFGTVLYASHFIKLPSNYINQGSVNDFRFEMHYHPTRHMTKAKSKKKK